MSATTEALLQNWATKTDAATPGPWEHGDRQSIAGVKPEMFGEGKCSACERHGEPTWTGKMRINGKMMDAHVHTATEPWWEHGIYAFREDGSLSVVYDTVEYGTMFKPDAEFIAMSRTAVPRLLAAVEAVRALHGEMRYHNPDGSVTPACSVCDSQPYPCETLQALDAALSGSEPDERNER